MSKIFAIYGFAVLLVFAATTYEGYAWTSLFASTHHSGPGDNHYHK